MSMRKITGWLDQKGKVERACGNYMSIASQNGIFVVSVHSKEYPENFRVLGGMLSR